MIDKVDNYMCRVNIDELFFELVRVAVGHQDSLSRVPSKEEWGTLYGMAVKQALAGVCFWGVQQLPKEMMPPKEVMLRWLALTESVRKRNLLLNVRAEALTERFAEGGFRSCVLKGQGVAELYPSSLRPFRQSGDIDIWVDGERDEVLDYARTFGELKSVDFKHSDFKCFEDVEVEIHSTPTWFYSPVHYCRFHKWLDGLKEDQFSAGKIGFAHPTIEFNVVYVLIHIYKHLFDEGVGMRQLMDYLFVLKARKNNLNANTVSTLNDIAYRTFQKFGMGRFVGAVMWLMQEVFGLDREYLLCEPDEKYGRKFLDIVIIGGNFGQYDRRNQHGTENVLQRGFRNMKHNVQLLKDYPSEVLWAPLWKVWHFMWRKHKGFL